MTERVGLAELVRRAVSQFFDSKVDASYSQLRVVDKVEETEPGTVRIDWHAPSMSCSWPRHIASEIRKVALSVEGVQRAVLRCRPTSHWFGARIDPLVNEPEGKKKTRRRRRR